MLNKLVIKIFKGLKTILGILVENRRVGSVKINIALNIKIFGVSIKASVLK